ncbi:MAG: AraC family transcriptional regulator [Chitinophagaceae bacterium]
MKFRKFYVIYNVNTGYMFYKKFEPQSALASYIVCYYIWESEKVLDKPLEIESPPPAFSSIVFNYGDDYFVSSSGSRKQQVPEQFVIGQQTRSYTLHLTGKVAMAGIVFKPTGIASIFKIPMHTITQERIDLRVFIDYSDVKIVADGIASSQTAEGKVKALEEFIMKFFLLRKPVPDAVDHAANIIVENWGKVNIDDLCKQVFISRRQFERKFLQKVGLSPKYYARLRRIGYICMKIAGKEEVNWQDLYNECEYYDQSHFIKDFTEFTGRPPIVYLNTNKELIHHLKAKD